MRSRLWQGENPVDRLLETIASHIFGSDVALGIQEIAALGRHPKVRVGRHAERVRPWGQIYFVALAGRALENWNKLVDNVTWPE